jgi:hypothetical protein
MDFLTTILEVSNGIDLKEFVLFAVSLGGASGLSKLFYSRLTNWLLENKYVKGLNSKKRGHEIVEELASMGPDRVLLFDGSNCGGFPRASAPYFVSCTDYAGTGIDEQLLESYKERLEVDAHYSGFLVDIIQHGKRYIDTKDLPEDTLMHRIYKAEKVTHSIWYYLGIKDGILKFISVSTHKGNFDSEEMIRLEMKISQLRKEIMG